MKTTLNKMKFFVARLAKSEEGVTAIEYALIAAGIAVAVAAVIGLVGNGVSTTFASVVGKL